MNPRVRRNLSKNLNWSAAPKGATHYRPFADEWLKKEGRVWHLWKAGRWTRLNAVRSEYEDNYLVNPNI